MMKVRSGAAATLLHAAASQLSPRGLLRTPPIWRESRMLAELARLRSQPIGKGHGFPAGRGRPVFLIPGYLAGDRSLAPLAVALRSAGFRPKDAGITLNVGCASDMVGPLEERLEAHVAMNGGRQAIVVGQSRGGAFGRLLAVRRPDLVASLVTLGTPFLDMLRVNLLVLVNVGLVGAVGSLGVPGVLTMACMREGACCDGVRREFEGPLPRDLPFLSIYSRSDGIVDWRTCLDPAARHVEVDSSHCGMALNADVWRVIAAELSRSHPT